ncbi:methyltransferase domain-containing protein [Alteraurantiacibacter palmitatis]|uniref:Methyltransferase domain-containing protein n=1 Tax=Alteraurantiacibacter palmitatis TaxID=2054628 RepID=A0ABV7E6Q1_9SPHN
MLAERRITEELMDDPALPEATYRAVLADLARVNAATLAARPTLAFLDRALAGRDSFALLDVGFGHGDMLRRIARWAAAQGKQARLVGVDLNPRSLPCALAATDPALPITYVTGDYADLAGEGFDCVVSSLVAHHMTGDQLAAFLRFMDAEAQAGWLVNDLHRHTFSYLGYPLLARLLGAHPIVRKDGQTSIARAFRPAEWHSMLDMADIQGARVQRFFPYRLCVSKIR